MECSVCVFEREERAVVWVVSMAVSAVARRAAVRVSRTSVSQRRRVSKWLISKGKAGKGGGIPSKALVFEGRGGRESALSLWRWYFDFVGFVILLVGFLMGEEKSLPSGTGGFLNIPLVETVGLRLGAIV